MRKISREVGELELFQRELEEDVTRLVQATRREKIDNAKNAIAEKINSLLRTLPLDLIGIVRQTLERLFAKRHVDTSTSDDILWLVIKKRTVVKEEGMKNYESDMQEY